ncbi:uncharacterized protein LODBEIA_P57180 [Lodderomyces beijingensis]|uniref:tRNA pseudouridine(55) synthase n=1 Tax=Lodderomyces beijingensis TaxID=1775926 RepID=A0ABP0ZKA7_9ASCO
MKQVMNGVFAINKPSGRTSANIIAELQEIFTKSQVFASDMQAIRDKMSYDLGQDKKWKNKAKKKIANAKVKIGHGGALDPLARGVLVVGVGLGTKKLQYYLTECQKTYEAKALLGIATTTGDSEGQIVSQNEIAHITPDSVLHAAEKFVGDIKQTPPIFSALKVDGKPLYEYAREGKPIPRDIKVREVNVGRIKVCEEDLLTTEHDFKRLESELDENGVAKEHALMNNPTLNDSPLYFSKQYLEQTGGVPQECKPRLLSEDESHPDKLPMFHFTADVSSGTYIRSLISDIGRAMDSSAYMVDLVRTKQSEWVLGRNVFELENFQRGDRVWGPVLKKVLAHGGEGVDLAKELAEAEKETQRGVENKGDEDFDLESEFAKAKQASHRDNDEGAEGFKKRKLT